MQRADLILLAWFLGELRGEFKPSVHSKALRKLLAWQELIELLEEELPTKCISGAEEQLNQSEDRGDKIVSIVNSSYPNCLRTLDRPPPLLFIRGKLPESLSIAIVGSRACTHGGARLAEQFAFDLTLRGFSIISGLARGIDGCAHRGAIKAAKSALTGELAGENHPGVAVLGAGLDDLYPPEHRSLAAELVESGGALISEFPYQIPPRPEHFIQRNRIISGLSEVTLVVEAKTRSGALSTARHAIEQGREVAALPGDPLRPSSAGTNDLLRQGAHIVLQPEDIIGLIPERLKREIPRKKRETDQAKQKSGQNRPPNLNTNPFQTKLPGKLAAVFNHLSPSDPTLFDRLVLLTGLPTTELASALLDLELIGAIAQLPGGLYVQNHSVDTA